MTEPEVNPIHKRPLWCLHRISAEETSEWTDEEKEWLFSDTELIAIRYALDTVDKQLSIAMPTLLTAYSKLMDHLDSELETGYDERKDENDEVGGE